MTTQANVRILEPAERDRIYTRLGAQFAPGGVLLPDKYVFEQLSCMPNGYIDVRRPAALAAQDITSRHATVAVLLDEMPNNARAAQALAAELGHPHALAFEVPASLLLSVLTHDCCDMYITTMTGDLLVVGCHEDRVLESGREVWGIVPAEA